MLKQERDAAPAPRRSGWIGWLDRRLYPEHPDRWDDELFRSRILRHLTPRSHVLDLGAGAGRVTQMNFRSLAAMVVGIDPDEVVTTNPFLDAAYVGSGESLPFEAGSFDLVFSDNVFEHVANPAAVFAEAFRILRPGGLFLIKTPNRWHYVAMIASLTPLWFHRFANRLRGRPPEHTFPTLYRANTARRLRRLAGEAGFRPLSIEGVEGRPEYLRITAPSYLAGWVYERIVNASPRFERLRVVLLATLEKPG